ncbi:MAG: 1-acyl-sn-glycerol-3-phosphate acyltransferase [Beggiatoa sp. IS2]|nr:MAG: 1-acyl-sn-glycerol-3-phosphate acyltransferase [Beggiatoa sp. IS2]
MNLFLRSLVFYLGFMPTLAFFACLSLLILPLPHRQRYHVMTGWGCFVIWWLKKTCDLTYQVQGLEHLPKQPAIVMSKHQSAWETIVMQQILPPQTWIIKRELLWIPLFGWALATLKPIAIDRKIIRKSIRQIVEQGRKHLQNGWWILMFPEGTRVAVGKKKRYGVGGAMLAAHVGCPIVPIALNSGKFWPRQRFLKYPGVIQVIIGPVIESQGKTAQEINVQVETWIETAMQQIP